MIVCIYRQGTRVQRFSRRLFRGISSCILLILVMSLTACTQPAQKATIKRTATPSATKGILFPTAVPFPTTGAPLFPTPTASPTSAPTVPPTPQPPQSVSPAPTVRPQPTPTPAQPTPVPIQATLPVGQSGSWNLIFHDEFTGTNLDSKKWTTCYFNFHVGTNDCDHDQGELELYQPSNLSVSNGILTLTARAQTVQTANGKTYQYTSGMISSGPSCDGCTSHFTFAYGYMEMRAWVPAGQGLWPAFWTLPADGSWPPEIDGFEILGHQPNEINMTYHWDDGSDGGAQQGHAWDGPDFSAGWHTFAVDWEPKAIIWYVDGVKQFQYTDAQFITSKPMYILANLAVGGDWPGSPDATTPFPARYQIDYIRVWQH